MATRISNPHDLLVLQLGGVLHVERRLAGGVSRGLVDAIEDEELRGTLERHLTETRVHVERVEAAFRRLGVAPSAHLSRPFESAVAEHDELAGTIVTAQLADVFHAQSSLHTEHWEVAAYTAILKLGEELGRGGELHELQRSLHDEAQAANALTAAIERLSSWLAEPR